ncbi:hypothetical protein Bca4012_009928 [Brassica carinata]
MRVMIKEDETYGTLEGIVRRHYSLRPSTPLVLTFQQPSWMLSPLGYKTPPTTINRTEDLCVLLNVRTSLSDFSLLVTVGPKRVAEYEFLCRTSFSIGSTTYVVDGTQTEENRADYERLVYGEQAKETESVMNALFSEEALMLFHCVSCEMAYADQSLRNQPSREIIVLDDDDHVMYEANNVNVETGQHSNASGCTNLFTVPITQALAPSILWEMGMDLRVIAAGIKLDGQLNINPPVEVEMEHVGGTISLADGNDNAVVDTVPNEGVVKEIGEGEGEGGGSSTGSTKNVVSQFGNKLGNEGAVLGHGGDDMHTTSEEQGFQVLRPHVVEVTPSQPSPPMFKLTQSCQGTEPSGVRKRDKGDKETSSEASDNDADIGNNDKEVTVGMLFRSREAFRQHMAFYAISRKFRFSCKKSEPGLMSLECCSPTCPWRVYAVRLKDAEVFEIRKVVPEHLYSIDERGGYETQATAAVIGELLKNKFGASGSGTKPREIRHMMRGDLNVNISCWKAWRSRDVAIDNIKESEVTAYAKLPDYLNKLVTSNPGTLVELFAEPHQNGGHRFKYLFVALDASIKGYEYMKKVVVVDGTHLKGKYGGCLLTASAQDGNYQIFPLAFAIVDGENDMSCGSRWHPPQRQEWFFTHLSKFVTNHEELVFVSDRHPSIFKGISKVYPSAGHCIFIVYLKRNIRSNFKGCHLDYLVAKAARSFRLQDFYTTFNEIKVLNGVLREARELPVIQLVEFICSKLMTWFVSRRDAANKSKANLFPRVLGIVTKNFEMSGGYEVLEIAEKEYEVPALKSKIAVESLVAPAYAVTQLRAAYGASIPLVEGYTGIADLKANVNGLHIYQPSTRRPLGRP